MIETLMAWSQWWWSTLAVHLLQSSMVFALVLLCGWLLRDARPELRHRLWLLSSLKFVIPASVLGVTLAWTGISVPQLPITVDQSWTTTLLETPIEVIAGPDEGHPAARRTIRAWPFVAVGLTAVWALGCVSLTAGWFNASLRIRKAIRKGMKVRSGRVFVIFGRARTRLGLNRHVTIIETSLTNEPLLAGIFKPVVLAPEGMAARLSDSELESVLMHELVHARRQDNLISFVQRIVCCLFWFWPPVWVIERRLASDRELACDREVIAVRGDSSAYVAGILKVCRIAFGPRATSVSFASGSNLQGRMRALMTERKTPRGELGYRLTFAAAVVLAAALTLTLAPAAQSAENTQVLALTAMQGGNQAQTGVELRDASINESPASVVRATVQNGQVGLVRVQNRTSRDIDKIWVAIEPEDRSVQLLYGFEAPVGKNAAVELSTIVRKPELVLIANKPRGLSRRAGADEAKRRLTEHPEEFRARVVGVSFTDGEEWFERGYAPPPPPPPPAPPEPPEPPAPPARSGSVPSEPPPPPAPPEPPAPPAEQE